MRSCLLTTSEAARVYRIPVRTMRRHLAQWTATGQLTRHGTATRPTYEARDIGPLLHPEHRQAS